jgi:PAS domain S-box-containing protein
MTDAEGVEAAARAVDVDEALKERAMDEAPVGITISDPSLPDNPLVYVNDAYERLTGYSRDEIVGRNCRVLQGPETRDEPVAEMRRAIEAGERVSVELRNYRKDGTEFWNRVDIAPIYEDGDITNFVGFQTDVTRRVLAEEAARERARELGAERRALEHVLERVNGLLADVTTVLVQATTRESLQRNVCRRVSGVDQHDFAWVGEYDRAEDAVTPVVGAAADGTELSRFDVEFGADDPVTRAVSERRVQIADAADDPGGLHGEAWPDRYESVAVVPLAYRESLYGVLCVYTTESGVFDDHDRVVLRAAGRAVATAINAVESHRRVATDERTELAFDLSAASFFPVALARDLDCEFEYVGAEQAEDGTLTLLFDASGVESDRADDAFADAAGVASASVVAGYASGALVEFEVPEVSLVAALAERGVDVESIEVGDGEASLVVGAPGDCDPRSVAAVVADCCPGAELTAVRQHAAPGSEDRTGVATAVDDLTDRQRDVLRRAQAAGFFEASREVSGEELADSMGVSPSTFHQHRRAALRKLVDAAMDAGQLDADVT